MNSKIYLIFVIFLISTIHSQKKEPKPDCGARKTFSVIQQKCIDCITGCEICTEMSFNCTQCLEGYMFDKYTKGVCVKKEHHETIENHLKRAGNFFSKVQEIFSYIFLFLKIFVYSFFTILFACIGFYIFAHFWLKKRGMSVNEMEVSEVLTVMGRYYGFLKKKVEPIDPEDDERELGKEVDTEISMISGEVSMENNSKLEFFDDGGEEQKGKEEG